MTALSEDGSSKITMQKLFLQPDKINLASFGNMVPHLHWHVIPRFKDDMHFPNPIWGQVERSINPAMQERAGLIPALKAAIQARLV